MRPLLIAPVLFVLATGPSPVVPARSAVLVELFTSEGCSSCPPADALLARLYEAQSVSGVEIIPLELHVDYWDRLGWKDPFSSAAFTRRQQEYSKIFGPDRVYTPQMVVDGTQELVGSDATGATGAITTAKAAAHMIVGVSAERRGGTVRIAVDAPAAPASAGEAIAVVVAIVEDGLRSNVTRGENSGRTLAHVAVVRRLESIGALDRDTFSGEGQWPLASAWQQPNLRLVAFLQGVKTRRVYGSTQAPLVLR